MGIYDLATQNDPFESCVINVGIGIEVPKTNNNVFDSCFLSPEKIGEILTWGCMNPGISFSFANYNPNNFIAENTPKIRKVDLKAKTQWLD